ncbi:DUF2244 domain-containing protein [Paracoccus sp. S-4012]|uniref:DUF2244 domain-containing protein n=1 Tax=Paracoccus sp. S-4012 TaxID=2665648 RepID=UPI0012AFDF8E|nr:DUF2244 domain-containing protein [Paracoccus sp. S-4012]MRX49179.1 DUF2244 domain-containing protein [Paracoccus sp. S-4012]
MPYQWRDHQAAPDHFGAVFHELVAWPHRSLPRRGFVWFIAITAGFVALPLLAVVGSAVLWGLLPFIVVTVWGLWHAIDRSYRRAEQTREVLRFDADRLELTRHDPGREPRRFDANPYWVQVVLRPGPVESYLTLRGEGREVELGAFLAPEERRALELELRRRLADLRLRPAPPPDS